MKHLIIPVTIVLWFVCVRAINATAWRFGLPVELVQCAHIMNVLYWIDQLRRGFALLHTVSDVIAAAKDTDTTKTP